MANDKRLKLRRYSLNRIMKIVHRKYKLKLLSPDETISVEIDISTFFVHSYRTAIGLIILFANSM